ncbi:cytochrome c oxidase assembly protein COX18, mitochondrial [Calliopsis andreniformis]|uniref:cytochrome c oxidase assembly protein COX18, mitochondrial n=1 Tax=Calliopsis andreniformis TaxID=337506 RepID=UPI003FCE4843
MAQMFRKVLLDFKYDNPVFRKFYHSINAEFTHISYRNTNIVLKNGVSLSYFLNERKFSVRQDTPSHQRLHTCFLEGPLCSRSSIRINCVSHYSPIINGIKHNSTSTNAVLNQAIAYNNGIVRSIAESLPVECIMDVFRMMHSTVGLPWWATIVLTTVLLRTFIMLPLTIHQHQVIAKLENLKHEMKDVTKTLKLEMKMALLNTQWDSQYAARMYNDSVRKQWNELVLRENCHPFKITAIAILQMPLWLGCSFAIRNFYLKLPHLDSRADQDFLELTTGGFGWIQDLTDVDHTFVLPVIFCVSNLAIIELQQLLYKKHNSRFRRIFTNFIRVLTILMTGLMAYIPSCLTLFWTTNTVCTLLQNILLMSPQFRRLGRIPKTDSESQQPYTKLWKDLKSKFRLPAKLS